MIKKKLKIAQIAPLVERVPPRKYGGTERIVSTLTEELVRRGHDVTLFATKDSITKAKLDSSYPRSLREAKIDRSHGIELGMYHIGRVYGMQEQFDIIHDHNSILGMSIANLSKTPTVITLHGSLKPGSNRLFETFQNPNFVSISKDQVKNIPNIKKITTIPNGLNFNNYPLGLEHKGYLLFVGRIAMEKGVHYAINVAEELNIPLIIAAKLDKVDYPYFKEYVEPRLYNNHIKWIGEVDLEERNKLMSGAICLLNPITWKEPFGLTMIEAMACGCPVIAFNNGSVPEVIVDGKTGFIVKNDGEMISAVSNISSINRKECKNYAIKNFNDKIMTDKYEELYHTILLDNIKDKIYNYALHPQEDYSFGSKNYPAFLRQKN